MDLRGREMVFEIYREFEREFEFFGEFEREVGKRRRFYFRTNVIKFFIYKNKNDSTSVLG